MRGAGKGYRPPAAVAVALFFAMGLAAGAARAQDSISALRARFDREADPVHKAKAMRPLGEAQFTRIREDVRAEKLPEALMVLSQYQEEVETCVRELNASGINAAKHPSGYKELEISVRESLRRLNEMLRGMTVDEQAPFLEVRTALSEADQRLVQQLFPGRAK